ncbi:MAG: integration host factor subunit alpha [Candidatus Pacebacteria bacterium]|nr:integration host factor subunit alpha [Candidatus Paceibacterota bacterium]
MVKNDETVTRAQLSEAVYKEVGLSRNESADLLEMVLNEVSEALVRGESVKISSFGSFSVRQKNPRICRNPKTGEEVPIDSRRVLIFRPSHVLKQRVNGTAAAKTAKPAKAKTKVAAKSSDTKSNQVNS